MTAPQRTTGPVSGRSLFSGGSTSPGIEAQLEQAERRQAEIARWELYGGDRSVTKESLEGRGLEQRVGAAQGHGRPRDPGDRLAHEVLGPVERRQGGRRRPLGVAEPRRVVGQEARGLKIDAHLTHLPPNVVVIGERLREAGWRAALHGLADRAIRGDADAEVDGRV